MSKKAIVITVFVVLIIIGIIIYFKKKNASNSSAQLPLANPIITNNIKATRMPTDNASITTISDAVVYSDSIVGYDVNDHVIMDGSTPVTTQEVATATSKTIPSGTTLSPIGITFLLDSNGLTVKYYQLNATDYVLADNVKPTVGSGIIGH